MTAQDIRWIQRFNHFKSALSQLSKFIEKGDLNELEQQGLIQAFEYTHELAWNTLKDFLEGRGGGNLYGSRDTTRLAFRRGVIENGEAWMEMIKDRNLTSHTYNEDVASKIAANVLGIYFAEFQAFGATMERLAREQEE
ncbi:MAG: nucleotidyltransferase substrate binding protein [Candidatus Coatesbacteria bacterium]|nr:nucleotidyltransferase substrate binding protein [Candidatus Coatesbacteria bacterium]